MGRCGINHFDKCDCWIQFSVMVAKYVNHLLTYFSINSKISFFLLGGIYIVQMFNQVSKGFKRFVEPCRINGNFFSFQMVYNTITTVS